MIGGLREHLWQCAAIVLAALLIAQTLRLYSARASEQTAIATLQTERATAAKAAFVQSEHYRQQEADHHAQILQIQNEGSAAIAAAAADTDRARAAGQRLQRQLADYLTEHRLAAIARAAAGRCAPDTTALDLLAELQQRADQRAGELAAIADTARTRGSACERAYDSAKAMTDKARQQ